MDGELHTYRAEDEGQKSFLQRLLAASVIHLKRRCPVMLIWNLSDQLVNGSRGTVVDFGDDGPIVEFPDANITMEVKPITFSGTANIN